MPEPTARIPNSILHDIKQMLGQEFDDDSYDLDIQIQINTVFFNLAQIGVGPSDGYTISGPNNLWAEFIGTNKKFEAVKTYIYYRVRLAFDPPTNGFLVTNMEEAAKKLEWTLAVEVDPKPSEEDDDD